MNVKEYGMIMFTGGDGKAKLIQPKSYTDATRTEQNEVLELLMSGEFIIVQVAMPRSTKEDWC